MGCPYAAERLKIVRVLDYNSSARLPLKGIGVLRASVTQGQR
jgi:hypothetical protein